MKRLIIGLVVLIALLGMGVAVSTAFCRVHQPTAALLMEASEAALEGHWHRAIPLARQARQQWEAAWRFTAAFADHAPMDEIDGLFAQLEIYGQQKNEALFPALCAQLSQLTEAMADSHRFRWWTVL